MSITQALDVLDQIESMGDKRKIKQELLLQHKSNQALQDILKFAYEWRLTYQLRVRPFEPKSTSLTETVSKQKILFASKVNDPETIWYDFKTLLGKLLTRSLTGNAARDAWESLVSRLSQQERKWYTRTLNRDLRIKFSEKSIGTVWEDLITPFHKQLANEYLPGDTKLDNPAKDAWRTFPLWGEHKLDGMRVLIDIDGDKASVYSRAGGDLFTLDAFVHPFRGKGLHCRIDCEVFAENWNTTMSTVKKVELPEEDRNKLTFYCFDLLHLDNKGTDCRPLKERKAELKTLLKAFKAECPNFKLLPHKVITSESQIHGVFTDFVAAGYEGLMLKYPEAPYEDSRVDYWLKYKPVRTEDVTIVGFVAGKEGTKREAVLGAFLVQNEAGIQYEVGGGMSDDQLAEFWAKRDELLGKLIEIEMQDDKNQVAKARNPVFLRLRLDRGRE